MKGLSLNPDAKKIQILENKVRRLEDLVQRLYERLDYYDRDRQRIKNDISSLSNSLRKT